MIHGTATMLPGDWLEVCRTLPADHFHVCATSPPYFALRSYLPVDHPDKPKEIGSEPTPEAFIECMVRCFREVRRVLRDDGVLWVNLGDSYGAGTTSTSKAIYSDGGFRAWGHNKTQRDAPVCDTGMSPGQLLNLPHRVAEALRADGWIWRQTIVWQKKSPMPESCKGWRWERCRVKVEDSSRNGQPKSQAPGQSSQSDAMKAHAPELAAKWSPCPGCPRCLPHGGYVLRKGKGRCTTAHEYLFVFSKSPLYFWDSAAFVEEAEASTARKMPYGRSSGQKSRLGVVGVEKNNASFGAACCDITPTRNPRSVWSLASEPSSEKHFAAYPSELARRMIQAATSDGGCCPQCGAPWAPMVEQMPNIHPGSSHAHEHDKACGHAQRRSDGKPAGTVMRERHEAGRGTNILGYRQTCTCPEHEPAPCRVLDPFAGTATTLQTAKWMGRDSTGVELNPEYVEIALRRLEEPPRWWTKRHQVKPAVEPLPGQKELF